MKHISECLPRILPLDHTAIRAVQKEVIALLVEAHETQSTLDDLGNRIQALSLPPPYVRTSVSLHHKTITETIRGWYGNNQIVPTNREKILSVTLHGDNGQVAIININLLDPWWLEKDTVSTIHPRLFAAVESAARARLSIEQTKLKLRQTFNKHCDNAVLLNVRWQHKNHPCDQDVPQGRTLFALQGTDEQKMPFTLCVFADGPWWEQCETLRMAAAQPPAQQSSTQTPSPSAATNPQFIIFGNQLLSDMQKIVQDSARQHHPVRHVLSRLDALAQSVSYPSLVFSHSTMDRLGTQTLHFCLNFKDTHTNTKRNFGVQARDAWWEGAYNAWMNIKPSEVSLVPVSADAVDFHRIAREEIEKCRTDGEDRANTRIRLRKAFDPYVATGKYEIDWCNVERDPTPNKSSYRATVGITASGKPDEDGDTPLITVTVPITDPWW